MTTIEASSATMEKTVRVSGLTVQLRDGRVIVDDVSFEIAPGEILGMVGQSGSGKTTTALSLFGFTKPGAQVSQGRVLVGKTDVEALDAAGKRALRGRTVSYVPQDPRASLDPAMRIDDQIEEVLDNAEYPLRAEERRAAVEAALADVGLPNDREFLRRYPHQLSGGQLQRVGIAMALVGRPPVIVLDEPTTGLDVATQSKILALVRRICTSHNIAALYITHDLAVVADIADRVVVLHHGRIVESGTVEKVYREPQHSYTKLLLSAAPDLVGTPLTDEVSPIAVDSTEPNARLDVKALVAGYRRTQVLHGVDFTIDPGECVAVVGESGSGKSTLSRAVIGLHPRYTGTVSWRDRVLPKGASARRSHSVNEMQYIFQSPYNALNPRLTVGQSLTSARKLAFRHEPSAQRREAIESAVRRVELEPHLLRLRPNRLSGGERQRIAIARALVAEPRLLICDEVTSSLDVLIQASIIELLHRLREQDGLSLLFVTHDLALVRSFADRVLVLNQGRIVEQGPTAEVLANPRDPYTRDLLRYTLSIAEALDARYGPVSEAG
ncbi:MAG TPA: ABC transporter ATP-binding protein [Pseudolysinimonas sp.]|nr:ABC transporter ATP-binding protein [Pseudolysinimonas sp.]